MATRKERFWYIDRQEVDVSLDPDASTSVIGLVEKATNAVTRNGYTTDFDSISVTGTNNLRLYCICQDADLSAGTLTGIYTNIPNQYHEALVYRVIAHGYRDPRHMDLNTSQYFEGLYLAGTKDAKRFARSNYQTVGAIKAQDF